MKSGDVEPAVSFFEAGFDRVDSVVFARESDSEETLDSHGNAALLSLSTLCSLFVIVGIILPCST